MKVVVIEDDPDVVELVSLCIAIRWPDAHTFGVPGGMKGLLLVRTEHPDLVILDLGLPDIRGMDVLGQLRDFSDVPVIMLTGEDRDVDIALALRKGADDYMTKPFSQIELIARIEAVLRRSRLQGHVRSDWDQQPPREVTDLFEGTVRLSVHSEGSMRLVVNFTQQVNTRRPEIRVLRLGDNREGGVDIWLGLREPMPLRTILGDLDGVAEVSSSSLPVVHTQGSESTSLMVSLKALQTT